MMRNARGRRRSIQETPKYGEMKSSNRHRRGDRALSVGCQHRSLYVVISELTPSMPFFQDHSSIPLKKLLVVVMFVPVLHSSSHRTSSSRIALLSRIVFNSLRAQEEGKGDPRYVIMPQNGKGKPIVESNSKSTKENSKSEKFCKCYCQGGKRVSYPYGWTTTTSTTATASFQYDSIDELPHVEGCSTIAKSSHVEHVSYQTAHPVAMKHLESQTLERKPSVSTQVLSALIGNSGGTIYNRTMGKVMRILVAGSKKVGKTACLEQLACLNDITNQPYVPTIEDTYQVQMDYGDRPKEIMVFHDTAGISESGPIDLKRSYVQVADAFLLVYSTIDHETFNRMDMLKKTIDKQFGKEKKEVPIVVLGNMTDLPGRKVDSEFARSWATKEKVKLYEVTAKNRNTLVDLVLYLGSRHFHSQRESKFSLSKKLKAEKSNTAIIMDL
ncbi:NF-kappa-B inhibitor-interacting Ras-like protein [Dirofilaria immitis]